MMLSQREVIWSKSATRRVETYVQIGEKEHTFTYFSWFNLLSCKFSCFSSEVQMQWLLLSVPGSSQHASIKLKSWVTFRNASQKTLDLAERWNWLELCTSQSCWGLAAYSNSAIAQSHFSIWLCSSHCQSSSWGAVSGKGVWSLCLCKWNVCGWQRCSSQWQSTNTVLGAITAFAKL